MSQSGGGEGASPPNAANRRRCRALLFDGEGDMSFSLPREKNLKVIILTLTSADCGNYRELAPSPQEAGGPGCLAQDWWVLASEPTKADFVYTSQSVPGPI